MRRLPERVGRRDWFGPATKVPSHAEAVAAIRQAHAEFKARQAERVARAAGSQA